MSENVTVFGRTFWDLWLQKIFRNLASMKFQWMLLLYVPVVWGMFNCPGSTTEPWVSATQGLTFLGGGFVTLATSRIIARTKLTESGKPGEIDCDK